MLQNINTTLNKGMGMIALMHSRHGPVHVNPKQHT